MKTSNVEGLVEKIFVIISYMVTYVLRIFPGT